jgi:hypothetical protein
MIHKFEEYPELSEMMQEYASYGRFKDWQKFTDVLNESLIKAENLPIPVVIVPKGTLCDVCGSKNTIAISHKGENCDWCNPL